MPRTFQEDLEYQGRRQFPEQPPLTNKELSDLVLKLRKSRPRWDTPPPPLITKKEWLALKYQEAGIEYDENEDFEEDTEGEDDDSEEEAEVNMPVHPKEENVQEGSTFLLFRLGLSQRSRDV